MKVPDRTRSPTFTRRALRPIARAARPAHHQLVLAILAAVAALLLMPALTSADVTIGAEGTSPYGWEFGTEPYEATAGQVVTAPAGITSLHNFTLWLEAPSDFVFRAYVYAWSGTSATGPALYESGDLHAPGGSSYQAVPIVTGGVDVTPGRQYVIFLSRSADQTADAEVTASGGIQTAEGPSVGPFEELPPPYTEGYFVFLNNGYDTTGWTTRTWFESTMSDARFEATFDTPERTAPASPSQPAPAPAPAPTVTVQAGSPPPAHCVVPFLGDLQLAAVRQALAAAHCSLGTVAHHWFNLPKGELMEQNAHQGTILADGAKVDVWLSRGAHKRHAKRK
jgi:hypothetical protein